MKRPCLAGLGFDGPAGLSWVWLGYVGLGPAVLGCVGFGLVLPCSARLAWLASRGFLASAVPCRYALVDSRPIGGLPDGARESLVEVGFPSYVILIPSG